MSLTVQSHSYFQHQASISDSSIRISKNFSGSGVDKSLSLKICQVKQTGGNLFLLKYAPKQALPAIQQKAKAKILPTETYAQETGFEDFYLRCIDQYVPPPNNPDGRQHSTTSAPSEDAQKLKLFPYIAKKEARLSISAGGGWYTGSGSAYLPVTSDIENVAPSKSNGITKKPVGKNNKADEIGKKQKVNDTTRKVRFAESSVIYWP